MDLREAYKILKSSENDSLEEIKKKYKELSKKYHPDFYQNNPLADLAEEKLKEINEAYSFIMSEIEKIKSQNELEEIVNNIVTKFEVRVDETGREQYLDKSTLKPLNCKIAYKTYVGMAFGDVKNGYKEGEWQYTKENDNNSTTIRDFINGILNGKEILDNRQETNYVDGIVCGKKYSGYYNDDTYKELILSSEGEYDNGKLMYEIDYTSNPKRTTIYEKEKIKKKEEINTFYVGMGSKNGKIKLYYDDRIEEANYYNGKIHGFVDIFYNNGKIEKNFYLHGRKIEKVSLAKLNNVISSLNYKLSYKKVEKLYNFDLEEFNFFSEYNLYYNYLKKIMIIEMDFSSKMEKEISPNKEKEIFENWITIIRETLLSWANEIELNDVNYSDAEANKTNWDLIEELKPENFEEDFVNKIRKRDIELKISDLYYYQVDNNITNYKRLLKEDFQEIRYLFKEEFFPHINPNISIPEEYTEKFWIEFFMETHQKGFIPNDLILIENIVLVNNLEVRSLINIYIGLKYNFINLVKESVEILNQHGNIEKNFIPNKLLEILGLKNIKCYDEFIEILEFLFKEKNYDISSDDLKNLKKEYNKISIYLSNINNKNSILYYFNDKIVNLEKILNNLNNKINEIEEKIKKENEEQINKNINNCEKILNEIYPLISKLELNRGNENVLLNYLKKINDSLMFLNVRKNKINISEEHLKKIYLLYDLKNIVINNLNYYEKILEVIKGEKQEAKNQKNSSKGTMGIIFIIICIFFAFSQMGFLVGILSIFIAPIIVGIIIGVYSNSIRKEGEVKYNILVEEEKKVDEILLSSKWLEELINKYEDRLKNILPQIEEKQFCEKNEKIIEKVILKNEKVENNEKIIPEKKIENDKKILNHNNLKPKTKKLKILPVIIIIIFIIGYKILNKGPSKNDVSNIVLNTNIKDFQKQNFISFEEFLQTRVNEKNFLAYQGSVIEYYESGRVKVIGDDGPTAPLNLEDKGNWNELEKFIEGLDKYLNEEGALYYFYENCRANEMLLIAEKLNKNKTKKDLEKIKIYEKKLYNIAAKLDLYYTIGEKLKKINEK